MRRKTSISPQSELAVLIERMAAMQKQIRVLSQAKMSSVQTARDDTFTTPQQGMVMIDWSTSQFCWYHDGEWICVPPNPTHAIKVWSDERSNKVKNGAFRWCAEQDIAGMQLFAAAASNGIEGAGATTVQISNQTRGVDLLTVPITIDSGIWSSYFSATQPTINTGGPVTNPYNRVALGDRIWIDVDAVGTGSKGLAVFLTFIPFRLPIA